MIGVLKELLVLGLQSVRLLPEMISNLLVAQQVSTTLEIAIQWIDWNLVYTDHENLYCSNNKVALLTG